MCATGSFCAPLAWLLPMVDVKWPSGRCQSKHTALATATATQIWSKWTHSSASICCLPAVKWKAVWGVARRALSGWVGTVVHQRQQHHHKWRCDAMRCDAVEQPTYCTVAAATAKNINQWISFVYATAWVLLQWAPSIGSWLTLNNDVHEQRSVLASTL